MESTQLSPDVWSTDCHQNKVKPGHHKLQLKDRERHDGSYEESAGQSAHTAIGRSIPALGTIFETWAFFPLV